MAVQAEDSKVIRVPLSCVDAVKALITEHKGERVKKAGSMVKNRTPITAKEKRR